MLRVLLAWAHWLALHRCNGIKEWWMGAVNFDVLEGVDAATERSGLQRERVPSTPTLARDHVTILGSPGACR
jgi:hypothetical protein